MQRISGRYERTSVAGEEVKAFVPAPLPPSGPPMELGLELTARLEAARHSVARLELASTMVPSVEWFVYAFVRKEAVLSSQIEGTQATLDDLLAYEAESEGWVSAGADVEEVCNYLVASDYGTRTGDADRDGDEPAALRALTASPDPDHFQGDEAARHFATYRRQGRQRSRGRWSPGGDHGP